MSFSIRDLLLVTVIVAVCVAWWVDRTRLVARHRPYEEQEAFAKAYRDFLRIKQAPAPYQLKK